MDSSVFSQSTTSSFIRIFDLLDSKTYINSNYFPSNRTIELNILSDKIFSKRLLYLNSALSTMPISSMIMIWNMPILYVFVNCILAGQIRFSDPIQLAAMSIPYLRKNAILGGSNGKFFDTVQSVFIQSGCVSPDFLTRTSQSTTISSTTTTFPTTTTSQMSPTLIPNIANSGKNI